MPKTKKSEKISEQLRNWYLYNAKYCTNSEFNLRVNQIFDKWGLPITNTKGKDYSDYLNEFKRINGDGAVGQLIQDIIILTRDFDLGIHWVEPYFWFFLVEDITPTPKQSFSIKGDSNLKRITIDIGPHTTLEDIKGYWHKIEELQKTIWPKVRQSKISKNTIENLLITLHDISLRYDPEKLKWCDLVELAEFELEKNDAYIVTQIWSNVEDISKTADQKRVERLRQLRSRSYKLFSQ